MNKVLSFAKNEKMHAESDRHQCKLLLAVSQQLGSETSYFVAESEKIDNAAPPANRLAV